MTVEQQLIASQFEELDKMRNRLGPRPLLTQYEAASVSEKQILLLKMRSHTRIDQMADELCAGHDMDPLKQEIVSLLWRDIVMLRDIFPYAVIGAETSDQRRDFATKKHEDQQAKHDQWRAWQVAEMLADARFGEKSKSNQADILKRKYAIPEGKATIEKRLLPLPE